MMEDAGRFVPVQTLASAIKYGEKVADPRGSTADAFYTVMYMNGEAYNLKVVYDSATNTVFHFHFQREALDSILPEIN